MYTLMRIETKIDDEIFLSCLLIYREDWFEDLRGYVSNNDSHWRIVRVMSLWVKTKIGDEIFPRYFSFHWEAWFNGFCAISNKLSVSCRDIIIHVPSSTYKGKISNVTILIESIKSLKNCKLFPADISLAEPTQFALERIYWTASHHLVVKFIPLRW